MDSNQLDTKIQEFESRVSATSTIEQDGQFWRDTWALVKAIDTEFKTVVYATEKDKAAALWRFQNIVDQMREDRKRLDHKRTSQAKGSNLLRSRIINLARAAWPRQDGFAFMAKELTGLDIAVLAERVAIAKVKTPPLMPDTDPRERERGRLAELSARMKVAWDAFNAQKEDLLPKVQEDCQKILGGVQAELTKALDQWKAETLERKQKRTATFEQRKQEKLRLIAEMKSLIARAGEAGFKDRSEAIVAEWKKVGSAGMDYEDDLWAKFKCELGLFKLARKKSQDQKLQARLDNQAEFLQKLQQSVEHDKGVLKEKLEKRATVFEGPRADQIRMHLGTVIESLEQKIQSKKLKVKELLAEITEIRRALRDAGELGGPEKRINKHREKQGTEREVNHAEKGGHRFTQNGNHA